MIQTIRNRVLALLEPNLNQPSGLPVMMATPSAAELIPTL